jgi:hypothetical protein
VGVSAVMIDGHCRRQLRSQLRRPFEPVQSTVSAEIDRRLWDRTDFSDCTSTSTHLFMIIATQFIEGTKREPSSRSLLLGSLSDLGILSMRGQHTPIRTSARVESFSIREVEGAESSGARES